jgi:hypothetical protein
MRAAPPGEPARVSSSLRFSTRDNHARRRSFIFTTGQPLFAAATSCFWQVGERAFARRKRSESFKELPTKRRRESVACARDIPQLLPS